MRSLSQLPVVCIHMCKCSTHSCYHYVDVMRAQQKLSVTSINCMCEKIGMMEENAHLLHTHLNVRKGKAICTFFLFTFPKSRLQGRCIGRIAAQKHLFGAAHNANTYIHTCGLERLLNSMHVCRSASLHYGIVVVPSATMLPSRSSPLECFC